MSEVRWESINTAPKDGISILVFVPIGPIGYVAQAFRVDDKWMSCNGCAVTPSHWMPLPNPPMD